MTGLVPISIAITLALLLTTALPTTVTSGLLDGCHSTATPVGFPAAIAVCPAGDGQTLADVGARIDLVTRDPQGYTVSSLPSFDIWLTSCSTTQQYCDDANEVVDAWTDENGATTISGSPSLGGADTGVRVWMQAIAVLEKPDCINHQCLSLSFRSADIDGDLIVNMVDLAMFAGAFSPNPYDPAADYNFDGVVGLEDLAFFAEHFGHACP